MSFTVGRVAKLSGVTVKTLHHYDDIGLLSPSGRSEAGYRIYAGRDLSRLQRILFYRELDFTLEDIAGIVDNPQTDTTAHLGRQRELLGRKIARLERLVAAIDREMEAEKMNIKLTPEERLEVFGDFVPEEHEEEAQHRWGDSEAYRESQRRVSKYTKDDWLEIKAEAERIASGFISLFETGAVPDGDEAMDLAEAHRQHISRWYYDCTYEIHRGLGEMYVSDPRFRANYDSDAPGASEFIRDAIHANARRSS